MTIQSLTLENLRGFAGKHEVKFTDPNVAAFIGVNGSGKSTVLEAIASCLSDLLAEVADLKIKQRYKFKATAITQGKKVAKGTIGFNNLSVKGRSFIRFIIKQDEEFQLNYMHEEHLLTHIKSALSQKKEQIPIYAFYRAEQTDLKIDEEFARPAIINTGRAQAYANAINPKIDFKQAIEYFVHLIIIQNNVIIERKEWDYKDPRVVAYQAGLRTFLSILEDQSPGGDKVKLTEANGKLVPVYEKGEFVLELSRLSSGEKLVIGLVLDLMYRCVIANGHLENPLASEGTVLIDEIELHLHPRWQANIIKALTTTFPNIQFIVSTHSPLVINQLRDEQVFALRKDGIVPGTQMQETYGMDASAVITNIMGAPSRPPEISKRFDEVAKLLNDPTQKNLDKVREKLASLRQTISPNDLELLQFSNILSIEESAVDI